MTVLTDSESDARILRDNTEIVRELDDRAQKLLAQFQDADEYELAALKKKLEAVESLRATIRSSLAGYGNR